VSVQAMTWALKIAKENLSDSSARHVLLCLANYASTDGRGAFPSAITLSNETGLSERTVRAKLELLRTGGWIVLGNQALSAVYIDRHDRRPVVYDLPIDRGANAAPRKKRGADDSTGCNSQQNGVQSTSERGAESAPNPSLNHQVTEQQQPREISKVVDEQDREAIAALEQPADTRQRFAMIPDWEPDADAIGAQLKFAGLLSDYVLTAETLNSFKGFFIAKRDIRDSDAGWCYRLAKWIKRDQTQKATATPANDDDTSWANDLGDL
jgi:hypothetical protein